ncbi:MAG: hypothetical protein JWO19_1239 [Bryobacterales bacterium]|jgi:hypothetical protein|nr:hypothetical protein [Bryobacterales bacterium]
MKLRLSCLVALSALAVSMAGTAAASPIVGNLNIFGGVSVSATTIDFLPLGGGTGTAAADAFTNTLSFAVLNTGNPAAPATGTITDLLGGPSVGAVSVLNFLSGFTLAPNIAFDLTFINPGIYSAAGCAATPAAAGQTCTPPGSPFNLSNISSGGQLSTVISLGLAGNVRNTTTAEVSSFTGVLSTQIDNTSFQSILATLSTPGGSISTSYSGSFVVTAIPEPATSGLIGAALLGLGFLSRRRARS